MHGYTYKHTVRDAWLCEKCSSLVDDPGRHEESHQELVRVLEAWGELLVHPRNGSHHVSHDAIRAVLPGGPVDVPGDPGSGPGDPLDGQVEITKDTADGRSDLVGEP